MSNDINIQLQKKASFWYFFVNIIQKGSNIILIPLYTRYLSIEEYGIYTVSDSWLEILLVITSLNLFQNVFSVAIKKFNDRTGVSSAFCGLSIICITVYTLFLIIFHSFFVRLFNINFIILIAFIIYLLSDPIVMIWCSSKRYYYEYKGLIILTLIKCLLTLGLGATIVLINKNRVEIVLYAKALSELIVAIYAISDIYKKNHNLFNWKYWKFALNMGIPLIPYYLSLRILQHLDRIMIDYLDGTTAAAKYGLVYKVTSSLMMINSSLNTAFLPWLYNNYNIHKKKNLNQIYVNLTFLIFYINLFVSLLAPEIIKILGTQDYTDAIYVMIPVSMSAIFIFIYDQCVNIELYYEKNKINPILAILVSILNAILNWIFIVKFGFIAAGYTTFISYFIYMFLHIVYIKILVKKSEAIEIFSNKNILIFVQLCFISIIIVTISYKFLTLRILFIITTLYIILNKIKKIHII